MGLKRCQGLPNQVLSNTECILSYYTTAIRHYPGSVPSQHFARYQYKIVLHQNMMTVYHSENAELSHTMWYNTEFQFSCLSIIITMILGQQHKYNLPEILKTKNVQVGTGQLLYLESIATGKQIVQALISVKDVHLKDNLLMGFYWPIRLAIMDHTWSLYQDELAVNLIFGFFHSKCFIQHYLLANTHEIDFNRWQRTSGFLPMLLQIIIFLSTFKNIPSSNEPSSSWPRMQCYLT